METAIRPMWKKKKNLKKKKKGRGEFNGHKA